MNNLFDFQDKVAIITGAGSGMGKKTAHMLASYGATIIVADLNVELATNTSNEIKSLGGQSEPLQVNVVEEEDVKQLIQYTIQTYKKIDILINCAGISKNMKIIETSVEDWDRIYDINVKGTFLTIRETLPYMMKQNSGKIVNFSSMLGKEAVSNAVAYCSSKFAVLGITQGVAKEAAPYNINVNAVCPGIVMTEMMQKATTEIAELNNKTEDEVIEEFCEDIPLKRLQTPSDIAGVVTFLCSELSENMTGQGINVTGGAQMH